MRKNVAILAILILIICLGSWGLYILDPLAFKTNPSQAVYQVLMLFVLEGDWTRNLDLPWQIEVTRFLAPMASITGIILVITRDTWITLSNYFMRYRRNHLVIAGLGDKAWQFISSARTAYKIVVVELNPENRLIERARSRGIHVIIGNILDEQMFQRVGLRGARHLVAYTDHDGVNVELAVKARNYISNLSPTKPAVLRIHIHVNDTRISQRLANYPKFFSGPGSAEINFFSVYELNARILLNQYPPERYAQVMGSKTVHIALFYFGRMAEHFMIEAGRICHFANGTRIRFTIFDAEAERKEKDLRQEFPNVASLVDYSFQALPVHQPGALKKIPVEILNTVTEHVICLPTDEESFTLALALRSTILAHKNCNAPILVRMQQSNGLAQILESNLGQPEVPDGLYPFGMLDQTLHYENILSERLDNLARALHEDYVDQYLKIDKNRSSALRPWALLSEPQKKTNRLLADHLPFKLRSIRCSLTYKPLSLPVLNVQETEILARVEHERWRANQTFEGWRFGTNRIERARINPLTKNWDQIPEQERRVQKSAIKRLPELLESRLQLGMERNFIIGVTGHRLHKMDPDSHHLKQRIEAVLKEITDENPGYRFLIASPLAEGADRLVARLAMELFSMPLIVPLPLPYELYQDDFTDSDSVEEFKEFVGRAEFYFELPMRFGNLETLSASDDDPDCPRNKQYALAGAYLAETSDELIAIYDNKPASGIGGTGQIVRWRSDARIPEEFANLADFIQRPVMKYPRIITLSE